MTRVTWGRLVLACSRSVVMSAPQTCSAIPTTFHSGMSLDGSNAMDDVVEVQSGDSDANTCNDVMITMTCSPVTGAGKLPPVTEEELQ